MNEWCMWPMSCHPPPLLIISSLVQGQLLLTISPTRLWLLLARGFRSFKARPLRPLSG